MEDRLFVVSRILFPNQANVPELKFYALKCWSRLRGQKGTSEKQNRREKETDVIGRRIRNWPGRGGPSSASECFNFKYACSRSCVNTSGKFYVLFLTHSLHVDGLEIVYHWSTFWFRFVKFSQRIPLGFSFRFFRIIYNYIFFKNCWILLKF